MSRSEFRKLTRKVPFEPFRVEVSNGETFDITHPDMAAANETSVAITDQQDQMHWFALEHVVALHPVPAAAKGTK